MADDIRVMSHVELLDAYDAAVDGATGPSPEFVRAEILRRMDSAATSQREEIAPDAEGYQR